MRASDGKSCLSKMERGRDWKDSMERTVNMDNDLDHNTEADVT